MENPIIPKHIGFIMDGNGRWAKKRGMPRNFGHSQGASVFKKTINWCRELGVECATFYAFSTENWKRPEDEVRGIMNLLRQYIKDIREFADEDICIIILGDISKDNKGFIVGIALNYGGRAELTRAAKMLCEECLRGKISPNDVTEELVEKYLYTNKMPPLDLVIRPSGEQRLSNFLIWQAAYSEFVFMDTLWPDFTKKDLERAIAEFSGRNRRFGGV